MKMQSNQVFTVAKYGNVYAASAAASDYAKQFSQGWQRQGAPRLWVKWQGEQQGYVIEPNADYLPANPAWAALCQFEEAHK